LQDLMVCVEMFLASIAHHYAFHYKVSSTSLGFCQT
jgi:hypothetical protein